MNANKTPKADFVTARHEVGFFAPDGKALFSVNEGIPLTHAFDQLSILLSSAEKVVDAVCVSAQDGNATEDGAHWASAHLLSFAYALVQSMHAGYEKGGT